MAIENDTAGLSLRVVARFREESPGWTGKSPGLMNLPREKAIRDFLQQGIPTRKNENYKYSPLQSLFMQDYAILDTPESCGFSV